MMRIFLAGASELGARHSIISDGRKNGAIRLDIIAYAKSVEGSQTGRISRVV